MTAAALPPLLDLTWAEALVDAAARFGDRAAFCFAGPEWEAELGFARWLALSDAVAVGLRQAGVGVGDRVAMLSPGSAAWPIVQTAVSALGAVLVPLNTRYRRDELEHVLGLTRPAVVVTVASYHRTDYRALVERALRDAAPAMILLDAPDVPLEVAAQPGAPLFPGAVVSWSELVAAGVGAGRLEPAAVGAGAPVLMQFTSGTTAFPKGALLSSRATLGATWFLAQRMRVTADDVYFSTQPMYHVGGSVATTLMPLGAGPVMVAPERYTVEEVFRLIPRYGCTVRTGQAAMYSMELAHADFDPALFATLRAGWSGGTPELKRAIRDRMGFSPVTTIYGLTETAGTTTITDADDAEDEWIETCGRPIAGVEVAIDAGEGPRTDAGPVGEICVRGWSVMLGYYEDAAATAAAIDADGWFRTGDLGKLDAAGNLVFVDRIKDMIKPGGENVSAAEVERVIQSIPGVAQVAVVGRPDVRLGEVPVAFVEAVDGVVLDPAAIAARCAELMASFKTPKEVYLVESWPMTESGKILKRALRDGLAAEAGAGLVGQGG